MALVPSLFSSGGLSGRGGDPFLTLYREMNRLFDDVLRGTPATVGQPASRSDMLLAPTIDVSETDKELRIEAELPGVTEKDIEVSLNDDMLTVRAEKRQERKEDREGVHINERAFGTFQRSLRLPFQVNPDQVQARFENGVLRVTVPKVQQQERSRRIQIQGGPQQPGSQQAVSDASQASSGTAGAGQAGGGNAPMPTPTGGAEDGAGTMPGTLA